MGSLISGIFSNESAFGRAMNTVYYVVISSLLFALTTIPVFTIGAGLAGLNYTMIRFVRRETDRGPAKLFFEGFKNNFRQATLSWLAFLGLGILLYLELFWCEEFGGFFLTFRWLVAGVGVILLAVLLNFYPALVSFRGKNREILRDAVYFAFSKPLRLSAEVLTIGIPVMITAAYPSWLPLTGFLWVTCLTGIAALVTASLVLPVYRPFLAADADRTRNPS